MPIRGLKAGVVILLASCLPGLLFSETVGIQAASSGASDHLPMFIKGEWEHHSHLIYYDLEGNPKAYVFIFSRKNTAARSLDELTLLIRTAYREARTVMAAAQEFGKKTGISGAEKNKAFTAFREQIEKINKDAYDSGDYATVFTGATDDAPLVLRVHQGLPEVITRAPEIEEEVRTKLGQVEFQLGRTVYLGPFDIICELADPQTGKGRDRFFHVGLKTLLAGDEIRAKVAEHHTKLAAATEPEIAKNNRIQWARYTKTSKLAATASGSFSGNDDSAPAIPWLAPQANKNGDQVQTPVENPSKPVPHPLKQSARSREGKGPNTYPRPPIAEKASKLQKGN